jgi:hypothetical protein
MERSCYRLFGAFGFDWYDRACMNVLSLHASFELKQRINSFQPILDDGAQLFPTAFTGVHNLAERHRLAGQVSRDGSAQKTITVENADLAHVPGVEANRDLFTDVSCQR